MRRLLKFSVWKLALLLLLVLLVGLVISWRTYREQDPFPQLAQMADVAQDELRLRPQFISHLNLDLWRKKTKKYAGWGSKLLPALHQYVGKAIPYRPECPLKELATHSHSLVVMGFSGMRTLYVTLMGDFRAKDYLQCAGKSMKQRIIGGQNVWIGDDMYWWEGHHGALVGMGINPRPPMFSFALRFRLNLFGKHGVLEHILTQKGALYRGLWIVESSFAGMFSLSGLEDMRLPQGITLRFHRMEGELLVGEQFKAELNIFMRHKKHAMRLMGLYYLATSLAPKPLRTLLQPLKASRRGNFVQMTFRQAFSVFIKRLQALLQSDSSGLQGIQSQP